MDLHFGNSYQSISEKQFKVKRKDVIKTINRPDGKKIIRLGGGREIIYYLKKIKSKRYLLVEFHKDGTKKTVGLSFVLDTKFVEDTNSKEPLVVLEKIANTFGLPMNVGGQEYKFIAGESFPINNAQDTNIMGGNAPKDHSILPATMMRVRTDGNQKYLDISTAFCLDITVYKEYLKTF